MAEKKVKEREYVKKRDFSKTSEPEPKHQPKQKKKSPVFAIQKHAARSLHYDVRIEVGGTLKSWAVPKGPSMDPSVKRLAVPTEDHPMEYADFEGTIPEGEYGGGTMMLWDKGTYRNIKKIDGKPVSMKKSLEIGTVEIWLEGEKLKGGFALIRLNSGDMEGNWLMVKMKDEEADAKKNPVEKMNKSVKTDRTMEEISRDDER